MRYDDARHLREARSLWLGLRLLRFRIFRKDRVLPYGYLGVLSDHELKDIGLTRREAETGRRFPPLR
jgi:hypothetical protein